MTRSGPIPPGRCRDLPTAARGADAGGGDDDIELGGVPLAQQGDEVGRDPLR
jgi:hypothetical protein